MKFIDMNYNPVSCLHPKIIRNKFTGELMCVPCGICSACVTKKSSLWVSRLREESTCHTYTLFGTLTYDDDHLPKYDINDVPDELKNDTFQVAFNSSSDYISFSNSKIPCLCVSDIQKFFKRLRRLIDYNHGKNQNIRYFIVGEYGPTTFRPHYHFLLWFDSPDLVPFIKSYIYKAWKCNTSFKSLSSFLQRNKLSFVHGNAENYVAGYLNSYSHLPAILTVKPYRPFHCQSSTPPIGTIRLLKESLEALQSGNVTEITLHRLSSTQSVVLPMWRGLENRFFPKIIGFSDFSLRDRSSLYEISRYFGEEVSEDYRQFEKLCLSEWSASSASMQLLRKLFGDSPQNDISKLNSLHRLFNVSKRVHQLAQSVGISVRQYVERISSYYARKEYLSLKEQLKFEEKLSKSSNKKASLSSYPFLIDKLFYENLRELPFKTYMSYLEQFGLGTLADYAFVAENTCVFIFKKLLCDKILFDNHKIKIKKDYVANHPECIRNYSIQLKSFTY